MRAFLICVDLACGAGRWSPARRVVLAFELLARPIRRREVLRVDDFGGDHEQRVAAGNIESVEVSVNTASAL